MRGFLIGLQFLTQLPIRAEAPTSKDLAESYYFYPVVGFLTGAAAVVLRRILILVFPPAFSIVLVLAFLVWISGGLHEDGLADIADGMGGGWSRDARLTIMKDSRIGAFGAVALVLVLLAKYAALTSLNSPRVDVAILSAQMLGRWAFLLMGYFNHSAQEGIASAFMKGLTAKTVVVGTVVTTVGAVLLSGERGGLALLIASLIVAVASLYFRRRIGGVTGDCFGALFQFVEVATYAAFLA